MRRSVPLTVLGIVSVLSLGAPVGATTTEGVTVDPAQLDLELHAGEVREQPLRVGLSPSATVSKVDVYLLADTTGSMSSPIGAVRTGALDILAGLTAAFPSVDLQFGAGDFKDFPWDAYAFRHSVAVTDDLDAVRGAINGWFAAGGSDGPEGHFYAFDRLAAGVDGHDTPIGWRPGAKRILVTFGDAPAHDPVCAAISGLPHDITEASVTAALQEAAITFIGISTMTGYAQGMDDEPLSGWDYSSACTVGGTRGQATRLAEATNGVHLRGVSSGAIVDAIKEQIATAVRTINQVRLEVRGDVAELVTGSEPASYGPLEPGHEHALDFALTFTGPGCAEAGDEVTGAIDVLADGTLIASVPVTVTALGPDGLDALHGTPADGVASGTVAREVVPRVRDLNVPVADLLTTVNCDVVVGAEDQVDGA